MIYNAGSSQAHEVQHGGTNALAPMHVDMRCMRASRYALHILLFNYQLLTWNEGYSTKVTQWAGLINSVSDHFILRYNI